MAHLHRSVAALRIVGEDLIPEAITKLLGCEPTHSKTKGQVVRVNNAGRERIIKSGMWLLEATDSEPGNLDKQVAELIGKLTQDLKVWAFLLQQFRIDLYCGLFMDESNEGVSLSTETLQALGQRGIELGLDIYGPTQELNSADPCPCGSGKVYGECCFPKSQVIHPK